MAGDSTCQLHVTRDTRQRNWAAKGRASLGIWGAVCLRRTPRPHNPFVSSQGLQFRSRTRLPDHRKHLPSLEFQIVTADWRRGPLRRPLTEEMGPCAGEQYIGLLTPRGVAPTPGLGSIDFYHTARQCGLFLQTKAFHHQVKSTSANPWGPILEGRALERCPISPVPRRSPGGAAGGRHLRSRLPIGSQTPRHSSHGKAGHCSVSWDVGSFHLNICSLTCCVFTFTIFASILHTQPKVARNSCLHSLGQSIFRTLIAGGKQC